MNPLNEVTQQYIREHRTADVRRLALQSRPLAGSGIDFHAACKQIAGRQIIESKIPSWYDRDGLLFPERLALEQCSSEATARYKASLPEGQRFADLTGGFGVDTAFIAARFPQAVYVEKQAELAEIARHNFGVLGLDFIRVHIADGIGFLKTMEPVDCLYLDPARRSRSGKKAVFIEDCDPNLAEIQEMLLAKAKTVLLKLSPMLDIHAALQVLKKVAEIHIVSVENECKELLFLLRKEAPAEPQIICADSKKQAFHRDIFTFSEEKNTVIDCVSELQDYLYEPNVSILKAGFFKGLALRYGVTKLHPGSHLYTSGRFIPDFPGRVFRVEAVSSFNRNELKSLLSGIRQANIAVRNFPLSSDELRKKLLLKEGGEAYLFATTLSDGRRVLIKATRIVETVRAPSLYCLF